MKERIKWVDILRGLAMFFVIVGHFYNGEGKALFLALTGPIKMPLFYFISGFVFSTKKNIREFTKYIIFRLYIPSFFISLFPVMVLKYVLTGQKAELISYIYKFFSGEIFWFVPSFILSQIIMYVIHKLLYGKDFLILVISAVLFGIGFLTADIKIMDIWCFNTALTGVLYMNFGYIAKGYINKIEENKLFTFTSSLIIYIVFVMITICLYPGQSMDMHSIKYYNLPICFVLIISGIILCISIFDFLVKKGVQFKFWVVFGRQTIVVYLLHGHLMSSIKKIFNIVIPSLNWNSIIFVIICGILCCAAGTIIGLIIDFCVDYVKKKFNRNEEIYNKG